MQKASPERGGEPAKLVEGFLWNLLLDVLDFTKNPSVKPAACQLPFQGSQNKKPTLSIEPVSEYTFDFTLPERRPKTRLRQRREVRCST